MSIHSINQVHGLVYDPIPYAGGSKIATAEMLIAANEIKEDSQNVESIPQSLTFTVLTSDLDSWVPLKKQLDIKIIPLPSWAFLTQPQGYRYWFAQVCLAFLLMVTLIRIPKVSYFIGASGPGIDMALYVLNMIVHKPVIQLIHGPVAPSRSIGYCLTSAQKVYYLESTFLSISSALTRYYSRQNNSTNAQSKSSDALTSTRFKSFVNGLSDSRWPTLTRHHSTDVFWAASLLKWKGLETLVDVVENMDAPWKTRICYIQPKNTNLGVSQLPNPTDNIHLYHAPANLDEIRAQSGIFVSTSINEPFGLSVLESLAAGLCVVIPEDGAYWDLALQHGVDCLKYNPKDSKSLHHVLRTLTKNRALRDSLSKGSLAIASQYRAKHCYLEICASLLMTTPTIETSHNKQYLNDVSELGDAS